MIWLYILGGGIALAFIGILLAIFLGTRSIGKSFERDEEERSKFRHP